MTSKVIPKLSNCYIPLPLSKGGLRTEKRKISETRDSGDGTTRDRLSFRRLFLQSNVFERATGSSHVEVGHTKVIAKVLGPLTASSPDLPSNISLSMEQGTLHIDVNYIPHVGYPVSSLLESAVTTISTTDQQISTGRINSWTVTRETDLAARLSSALAPALPLSQYPKCALLISVTVLQDDGSVLSAALTAISLALADAGVELYDVVASGSVAVMDEDDLFVDPTLDEEEQAKAIVTLAMMPSWNEVTLWEQTGALTAAQANQAMELCRDGCRTIHQFIRQHLLERQQEQRESIT